MSDRTKERPRSAVTIYDRRTASQSIESADREALLGRVAVAVTSSLELREVLRQLAAAARDAIGADRCAVFTYERGELSPQVALGREADDALWGAFRSMAPVHLDGERAAAWAAGVPIVIDDARSSPLIPPAWAETFVLRSMVVAPLAATDGPCGLLALVWDDNRAITGAELDLIGAIADFAGLAVRNARLYERERRLLDRLDLQVRRLDCLYRFSAACAAGATAPTLVRRLNELLPDDGVEVLAFAFRDRRLARAFEAEPIAPEERAACTRDGTGVVCADGSLAIPMRLGRRAIAVMRVQPAILAEDQLSFLDAIGRGVAEALDRRALRTELEDAARERAVIAERERLADDLHDTAGQSFVAIGLLARRHAEELPAASPWAQRSLRLAELADRGKWEIDQAVRALAYVPASRSGIASAVRALGRSIALDSGIRIQVDVEGRAVRLPPRVEQAAYRIVGEALINSWRHARCEFIRVELHFDSDNLAVAITDDGVGLGPRHPEGPHLGLASMRRTATQVGGRTRIRSIRPHGVRIEAQLPRRLSEAAT